MQAAIEYIKKELKQFYPETEIRSFTYLLLSKITGLTRTEIILNKNNIFSVQQRNLLNSFIDKLKNFMPIQYILGECEFMGLNFCVDESVLIPRPETEELVEWIVSSNKKEGNISMLDIGTGSGCIAVALKHFLPNSVVSAYDISDAALHVARKNAEQNEVLVQFEQCDILNFDKMDGEWDVIVSNPPYIPENEKKEISPNVLDFEPHVALFVPENDALLFYRSIAKFAKNNLKPHGQLFFEIHRDWGKQTIQLLKELGFVDVELKKDLAGNDRMVKAKQI